MQSLRLELFKKKNTSSIRYMQYYIHKEINTEILQTKCSQDKGRVEVW